MQADDFNYDIEISYNNKYHPRKFSLMEEGLCSIRNSNLSGRGIVFLLEIIFKKIKQFAQTLIPRGTFILSEDAKFFIKISENCANFTKNEGIFGNCENCVSFQNLFCDFKCEVCDESMKLFF